MYNLYFAFWGLSVAVLGCMLHAVFNRRWSVVQGGVPLLAAFALLTVVFGLAK
jgi:hypothetical protein